MTEEVEINGEDVALNILKKHNIPELGNGHIVQPWPSLAAEVKMAIAYLIEEWDFAFVDTALTTQRIKDLVWQSGGKALQVAQTPFGFYGLETKEKTERSRTMAGKGIPQRYLLTLLEAGKETKLFNTEEQAKAFAAIDFAQRVRACTTPLVTEE